MTRTKYFILGIIASLSLSVFAAVFNQFGPATGILVGNVNSFRTTAATSANVIALWSGTCNSSTFLVGDGTCVASSASPAGDAGASIGTVFITGAQPNPVASMTQSPDVSTGNSGDCVSFTDGSGSIGDRGATAGGGVLGPCTIADPNGHPNLIAGGGGALITGTNCSGDSNAQDNTGAVTVTGSTTCTITFGSTFTTNFSSNPFCVVAGYSATVLPFISTPPSSTSVQVHTAGAGTFAYHCF